MNNLEKEESSSDINEKLKNPIIIKSIEMWNHWYLIAKILFKLKFYEVSIIFIE